MVGGALPRGREEERSSDFGRSYGDWRDDKTGVGSTSQQDMPTNSYPQQNKENEFIFTFAKTDGPFPALPLWEAPEPKQIKDAVISCRCGILAPPHVKGPRLAEAACCAERESVG